MSNVKEVLFGLFAEVLLSIKLVACCIPTGDAQ